MKDTNSIDSSRAVHFKHQINLLEVTLVLWLTVSHTLGACATKIINNFYILDIYNKM